jgi:hypothetical protein
VPGQGALLGEEDADIIALNIAAPVDSTSPCYPPATQADLAETVTAVRHYRIAQEVLDLVQPSGYTNGVSEFRCALHAESFVTGTTKSHSCRPGSSKRSLR